MNSVFLSAVDKKSPYAVIMQAVIVIPLKIHFPKFDILITKTLKKHEKQ